MDMGKPASGAAAGGLRSPSVITKLLRSGTVGGPRLLGKVDSPAWDPQHLGLQDTEVPK